MRSPNPTPPTLQALLLSGLLHGVMWWSTAGLRLTPPDLNIELDFGTDVTFGGEASTASSTSMHRTPREASTPLAEDRRLATAAEPAPAPATATPPLDARPPDAGADADRSDDASVFDAGTAPHEAPPVASRPDPDLPPGARIALRVDLRSVRAGPLGDEARNLLLAIPEWSAALRGSGIDPVRDLDHFLVAHPGTTLPNGWPDPARFAIAGTRRDPSAPIAAIAARMASTRGHPPVRRRIGGRKAWRWWDDSGHERWVTSLGQGRFLLASPRDLPALLALAANASSERAGGDPFARWVAPPEGAVLAIEAVGLRRFARRGAERIPVRLLAWVLPSDEGHFLARASAGYRNTGEATRALGFWRNARDAYARNLFVQLLGFGPLLQRVRIEQRGETLTARLPLTVGEARRILRQIGSLLPRRPGPSPGSRQPSSDTSTPSRPPSSR